MKSIREIVNKVFEVDIMKKYRYRKFVDARMVFSKILRDRGYTIVSIARFIKKDHTTILHYNLNFDVIVNQDRRFKDRYMVCLNSFLQDRDPIVQTFTDKQLYNEIKKLNEEVISLNGQIEKISSDKEMLYKMLNRKTRFDSLINIIDEKTPIGREQIIIDKIKRIVNDL
jgi:hypothetical protein